MCDKMYQNLKNRSKVQSISEIMLSKKKLASRNRDKCQIVHVSNSIKQGPRKIQHVANSFYRALTVLILKSAV